MKRALLSLVLLLAALSASAKNLYVPIAGSAPGANGTLFRTDLRIFNPSATETIGITVVFLPTGIDGSGIPGNFLSIGPRQMLVLNDVVGHLVGVVTPAIGALRLDSDTAASYEFSADSRIYTDSPNPAAPGTFGQYVPALAPESAVKKSVVLHVSSSSDLGHGFRTNAGVMNPYPNVVATVTPALYRADGTLIATGAPISVPGLSVTQKSLPALFGTVPDFEDGYITFDSTAPVITYASVVDNRSADQTLYLGAKDDATVTPIF